MVYNYGELLGSISEALVGSEDKTPGDPKTPKEETKAATSEEDIKIEKEKKILL
jgi:hypothetical protein